MVSTRPGKPGKVREKNPTGKVREKWSQPGKMKFSSKNIKFYDFQYVKTENFRLRRAIQNTYLFIFR